MFCCVGFPHFFCTSHDSSKRNWLKLASPLEDKLSIQMKQIIREKDRLYESNTERDGVGQLDGLDCLANIGLAMHQPNYT